MYFKQFLHDETGCASYFVALRQSREALVVDPQRHIQPYLDLARERDYRIVMVIETHLHADHISGNRALAAATGATLYLHEDAEVDFPFDALHDGDELHLGQIVIRVVHTPGHRPESISLVLTNPIRSPEPSMVLSGDTLFVGDVGRPDFGGEDGARAQYDVRAPDEFAAGHLPAAVSIPQAEIAVELPKVPRDRDVLVACWSGGRSLAASRFLRSVGDDRVMNLEQGTQGWIASGNPIELP
ncbi:MAG TPA: MBL fold metallo-hydrolase [Chloroflexota bacterium]